MKMEIKSKKSNSLMGREETMVFIEHKGKATPVRKEIISEASKALSASEDRIVVDKIFTEKGLAASSVKIFVYKSADEVPNVQKEKMKRRMKKKGAPAEAPAEAAKETPKEDAKKEEKTEEKK